MIYDVEEVMINSVTDAVLENFFNKEGKLKVDLSEYLEYLDEDEIESLLAANHYEIERIDEGVYFIKNTSADREEKQKALKEYVNECIKEEGFDEDGELSLDVADLFDLSPAEIIETIRSMGFECEMADILGDYWVFKQSI